MSRKTNRLRSRLQVIYNLTQHLADTETRLRSQLADARRRIAELQTKLQNSATLEGFRLAVRKMHPFERGYGKTYAMTMHMDMEAIKMGLLYSRNGAGGNPFDLGSDIHYLCRQLAENAAQEIWKQLKADGAMI